MLMYGLFSQWWMIHHSGLSVSFYPLSGPAIRLNTNFLGNRRIPNEGQGRSSFHSHPISLISLSALPWIITFSIFFPRVGLLFYENKLIHLFISVLLASVFFLGRLEQGVFHILLSLSGLRLASGNCIWWWIFWRLVGEIDLKLFWLSSCSLLLGNV